MEKAIVRLVNAKDLADMRALVKTFPDLMPSGAEEIDWRAGFRQQSSTGREAVSRIGRAQVKLRAAWKLPHGVLRRTLLTEIAGTDIMRALGKSLDAFYSVVGAPPRMLKSGELIFPPALLPRQAAKVRALEPALLTRQKFFFLLLTAHDAAPKMRVCHNSECPHPFYLRTEGGKQFCSKTCAAPALRAAKLKWWNRHKRDLLAKRQAASKRARRREKSNRREKRK